MKRIDLHIHTNCSDGSLTPFEVIDEAYNNKVNIISITDHDTVDAYSNNLIEYANKKGIKLISGVEISTKYTKCGIHVLGYNIDINDKTFKDKLYKIRNSRHEYLYNVSKKLNELGYVLNVEDLDKIDSVTKAHIALDIINNKLNNDLLLKEFGHIPSKGEFIETIMNEGCKAYVKKDTITPKDASLLIKEANGKVVLAHPVAYEYEDNLKIDDIKNIIKEMNADGIEAYYIYVDKNNIKHNDTKKWIKFSCENNLFTTIGSDFHTSDLLRPNIGLINEDLNLTENEINKIIDNICSM